MWLYHQAIRPQQDHAKAVLSKGGMGENRPLEVDLLYKLGKHENIVFY
jgi:hypothetical protein